MATEEATSVWGGEGVDFDEMKFDALGRLEGKLAQAPKKAPKLEEAIEDLQASFLERCDEVLLKTISNFMEAHEANENENELRTHFVNRLEGLAVASHIEDELSHDELIEECMHLVEQLEDPTASWFSLITMSPDRLKQLYAALEGRFDFHEVVLETVVHSSVLVGEDRVRFYFYVSELDDDHLLIFLRQFLQAELEYGQHLQGEYLESHPDLAKKVRARLNREAGNVVKRLA